MTARRQAAGRDDAHASSGSPMAELAAGVPLRRRDDRGRNPSTTSRSSIRRPSTRRRIAAAPPRPTGSTPRGIHGRVFTLTRPALRGRTSANNAVDGNRAVLGGGVPLRDRIRGQRAAELVRRHSRRASPAMVSVGPPPALPSMATAAGMTLLHGRGTSACGVCTGKEHRSTIFRGSDALRRRSPSTALPASARRLLPGPPRESQTLSKPPAVDPRRRRLQLGRRVSACLGEDIGRHNAVELRWASDRTSFCKAAVPLRDRITSMSSAAHGRASSSSRRRLASHLHPGPDGPVGAASSVAVDMATAAGMTLYSFAGRGRTAETPVSWHPVPAPSPHRGAQSRRILPREPRMKLCLPPVDVLERSVVAFRMGNATHTDRESHPESVEREGPPAFR